MLVWSNFHFRVLNHWLNVLVARINLYQDLYPMLSVQLIRLWRCQLVAFRRWEERKNGIIFSFSFVETHFSFIYVFMSCWDLIGAVSGSLYWWRDWKHLRHFRCITNDIENVCILTPAFIFSGCKFYFSSYSYVMVMSMWWWLVEQSPLSMLCLYVDLKIVVCILLWLKNGLNASVT